MAVLKKALLIAAVCLVNPVAAGAVSQAERDEALRLVERVDDMWRGSSSHGRMRMKVVTEHWSRELGIEFWSEGKENSLIRILSPVKERDTATLMRDRDIWNYLPKVRRVIKLPSSMMGASWMGSHFTNDDLVKESRFSDDYDFELTFRGVREGTEVAEVSCRPKEKAAVVWGKVTMTVRTADVMPLEARYFDEDLKLARTMVFSDFRQMGGRLIPCITRIVPADKPEERTDIIYDEIEFDLGLPTDTFSLRNLKRNR